MIYLLYPSKEEMIKIKKKACDRQYYLDHKENIKNRTKQYQKISEKYKQHKRIKGAEWRRDNPQYFKEYYKNNKEKLNKMHREYYSNNKGFVNKINADWQNIHIDIVRSIKRKYKKTPKGKITSARHHDKRRYMGSNLLNDWFKGCNRHHINKEYIICVPKDIHTLYHHNHKKPETMTLINLRAFEYLMCC